MGFLDKLWDETLAGPAPDTGLGKLRKYNSLSATKSTGAPVVGVAVPSDDHLIPITRSITMVRRDNAHRNLTVSVDSPPDPSSPTGSTTPCSPFSPSTPGGNFRKFTRRKPKSGAFLNSETESKAVYDWIIMLNSMDR
ncbi:hypothetical protein ABFS82_09G126900 [Erythranthe guttata]